MVKVTTRSKVLPPHLRLVLPTSRKGLRMAHYWKRDWEWARKVGKKRGTVKEQGLESAAGVGLRRCWWRCMWHQESGSKSAELVVHGRFVNNNKRLFFVWLLRVQWHGIYGDWVMQLKNKLIQQQSSYRILEFRIKRKRFIRVQLTL